MDAVSRVIRDKVAKLLETIPDEVAKEAEFLEFYFEKRPKHLSENKKEKYIKSRLKEQFHRATYKVALADSETLKNLIVYSILYAISSSLTETPLPTVEEINKRLDDINDVLNDLNTFSSVKEAEKQEEKPKIELDQSTKSKMEKFIDQLLGKN